MERMESPRLLRKYFLLMRIRERGVIGFVPLHNSISRYAAANVSGAVTATLKIVTIRVIASWILLSPLNRAAGCI